MHVSLILQDLYWLSVEEHLVLQTYKLYNLTMLLTSVARGHRTAAFAASKPMESDLHAPCGRLGGPRNREFLC